MDQEYFSGYTFFYKKFMPYTQMSKINFMQQNVWVPIIMLIQDSLSFYRTTFQDFKFHQGKENKEERHKKDKYHLKLASS